MSAKLPVATRYGLQSSLVTSSTMIYGCEAWKMVVPVKKMLNSTNSKQLSLITKRTIHQEAKSPTIDVLMMVKKRRHQYLGHILRLDPNRLLYRFLIEVSPQQNQGALLSEIPHRTLDELMAAAADKDEWRQLLKNTEEANVGELRASLGTARSR